MNEIEVGKKHSGDAKEAKASWCKCHEGVRCFLSRAIGCGWIACVCVSECVCVFMCVSLGVGGEDRVDLPGK